MLTKSWPDWLWLGAAGALLRAVLTARVAVRVLRARAALPENPAPASAVPRRDVATIRKDL